MSQIVNRIIKWTCSVCGHINPSITGTCRLCGN
jgi:hypothetical protein